VKGKQSPWQYPLQMKAPSAIAFAELACADHVCIAVDAKQEFGIARGSKV
jgi:hypothetical protein